MKTGITGLPFSGKTTLFCALTGQRYDALAHTREIHMGTVKVPDPRLERLFEIFRPMRMTPATMEFFDIAGQAQASGKGMDPQTMQTLRNADALIAVLDAFSGGSSPERDLNDIAAELALGDLVVATGRLERIEKELRSGKNEHLLLEQGVLERCRTALENGESLRILAFGGEEEKAIRGYRFLSLKPLLVVVNISEADLAAGKAPEYERRFEELAGTRCAAMCAEVEMEIAALDEADRPGFLASMGIEEPALGRLIRLSYESLGLISFFTGGGPDEVRAWTVRNGAKAPECAGIIHSDMERGFIRAETVAFRDLDSAGSLKAARERGVLRIEGKDYTVVDGDVLTIRFSV